ncbi:hypothetical protein BH24ACT26_BH24ACT26_00740 [soil metagenome]
MASSGKRILLWHGYLLSGSGSNVYTANLARSWRAAGHDVLVLCQERQAHGLPFVDAAGDFSQDNSSWSVSRTGAPPASGSCTVVRPNIDGLLPVYVYDDYEGFTVKRFVDLDEEELDSYTAANVEALVGALRQHEPDAVVTGHEVMGPEIARRACERTGGSYLAKLHGSALEYAVKHQERYLAYARSGLRGAQVVAGGSRYMVEEASAVVPGWKGRAVVVNPGCDVDLFRPLEGTRVPGLVGYVGKLIAAKGVHNLLGSLGLTSHPGLEVAIVGYGDFEAELRALADGLGRGDHRSAHHVAHAGEREGPGTPLERLLASSAADDAYFARAAEVPVAFHGRLDHGPLSRVLPTFEALVVPSVVPEAFGMVAAEAAACGVLPIVPRHSGIGEVGAAIEDRLGAPGLLTYDPADPVRGIADAIDRVLAIPRVQRAGWDRSLVAMARERWSWAHVADLLLRLAARPHAGRHPG